MLETILKLKQKGLLNYADKCLKCNDIIEILRANRLTHPS